MCMEPISAVSLPRCYIVTVNESETITVAQEFCPVRSQKRGRRAPNRGCPAKVLVEVHVAAQIGAQDDAHVERS